MKIRISGDTWTVKVVTSKQMKKHREDGEGLAGLCIPSQRLILICNDSLTLEVVTHELYHGYFSYLYLDDVSNISLLDLEEITANFFCSKAAEILRKAKTVMKKLSQQENDDE